MPIAILCTKPEINDIEETPSFQMTAISIRLIGKQLAFSISSVSSLPQLNQLGCVLSVFLRKGDSLLRII